MTISPEEARTAKEHLDLLRQHLKSGVISYGQAKMLATVPLQMLNDYMKQRAKDFGVKHKQVSFVGYMR